MTNLGARLKEERQRLALHQRTFAQQANVSVTTQRLYEQGRRTPAAHYLANIALLGVDVLYVLTGRKIPQGNTPRARQPIDGKPFNWEALYKPLPEELSFKLTRRKRNSHLR